MYSNGMTIVRADFHLHTRKDKEFKYTGEDNSFVTKYIDALKEQEIQVGVITNHNKFDVDEFKALRKKAGKNDIFLLPGVELSVKEGSNGVHTLIVFDPDKWLENGTNHIEAFLTEAFAGIVNRENENTRCLFDLSNVIKALDKYQKDYFIIFAHVEQNSGFLKECGGGLIESLFSTAGIRDRVLAMQKMHSQDLDNKLKQWIGYRLPNVEGSDPKAISEIGKGRKTYIKIGDNSFAAVKYALQDFENRIVEEPSLSAHGHIKSVSFVGGKLDGVTINFSSGLNTLIGIRGSGKSSILEVIRYALSMDPNVDENYKKDLVKNMLGSGGQVSVKVQDKYGREYEIRRILNESPSVIDSDGADISVSARSVLNNPLYFGQKDLSQVSNYEFELLERLVGARVPNSSDEIDEEIKQIETIIHQVLDVSAIPKQEEEAQSKLNELNHKMKIFQERGVADKLKKQTYCSDDLRKLNSLKEKTVKLHKDINAITNKFNSKELNLEEYKSEFNQDIIEKAEKVLVQIGTVISAVTSNVHLLNSYNSEFEIIINELNIRIDSLKEEFAAIKREIKDETIDPDTFIKLAEESASLSERINELQEKGKSKVIIIDSLKTHIRKRNELLLEVYKTYVDEAEKINTSQTELHIDIEFKGDKDGFKDNLKKQFRGSGISEIKYQQMSEKFSDFVAIIEDWLINEGLQLREILSETEYVKLIEKLMQNYPDIIRMKTEDRVDILYHGKELKKHSIGQRASALILFILTQKDNDVLIIDQPEDDLDNKVIYDEVIKAIKARKPNIQFIFATHNANIPVLGDSEKVIATDFLDDRITILQGNIDMPSTHQQIVDIMEGGKEAFDRRRMIYTSWASH